MTASFPCDNQWCIHEDLKCDGVDHCGDSSDEDPVFVCLPEGGSVVKGFHLYS